MIFNNMCVIYNTRIYICFDYKLWCIQELFVNIAAKKCNTVIRIKIDVLQKSRVRNINIV